MKTNTNQTSNQKNNMSNMNNSNSNSNSSSNSRNKDNQFYNSYKYEVAILLLFHYKFWEERKSLSLLWGRI